MLTTGFKFYFGMAVAAVTAAILFGYTTGGNNTGPISLGWKGSVGNHTGYIMLLGAAAASVFMGFMMVAFRDADPRSAAELLGVDAVPPQRPTQASLWPLMAMFAVAALVLGLVLSPAIFVVGLVLLAVVGVEWTMEAWADRATGDPATNRELRNRVMQPIELPVLAALGIIAVPLGISRVFLSTSKIGAVWVASVVAVVVLAIAALFALKPKLSKNLLAGVVLVGGLAFIASGITAAAIGERNFAHHGEHSDEGTGVSHEAPGEGK